MTEWISIKESLPKKGERVKAKLPKKFTPYKCGHRILYRMKHNVEWNDYNEYVTHWMPLTTSTDYQAYITKPVNQD